VIASTRVALRHLQQRTQLREQLWRNAYHLYDGLKALGFVVGPQASPVVAVKLEDRELALRWWPRLLEMGVYVNLVVPASPRHCRCAASALPLGLIGAC
jgi:8-amino-7-oxononanoate synthase